MEFFVDGAWRSAGDLINVAHEVEIDYFDIQSARGLISRHKGARAEQIVCELEGLGDPVICDDLLFRHEAVPVRVHLPDESIISTNVMVMKSRANVTLNELLSRRLTMTVCGETSVTFPRT